MTPEKTPAPSARQILRNDKPDTWIAVEAGDKLHATVEDLDVAWSDVQAQGGDGWYPLLRVVTLEGTSGYEVGRPLTVHAFSTVMRNEILRRQPLPGENITLEYLGQGEIKVRGQNAPELYRLTVEGRDPREQAKAVYGQLRPRGPAAANTPPPVANGNPQAAQGAPLPAELAAGAVGVDDGSDHPFADA